MPRKPHARSAKSRTSARAYGRRLAEQDDSVVLRSAFLAYPVGSPGLNLIALRKPPAICNQIGKVPRSGV
jgi:hypothetical protein